MLGCIDHKRALGGVSVFTEISDQEALSCNLENQYLLFFFLPQIKHQNLLFRKLLRFRSVTQPCPTLCDPMDCSMPGLPVHHHLRSLLKLMSFELVMPSKHLILCHYLLGPPSIFPSIRIFSNESVLRIRWPKY